MNNTFFNPDLVEPNSSAGLSWFPSSEEERDRRNLSRTDKRIRKSPHRVKLILTDIVLLNAAYLLAHFFVFNNWFFASAAVSEVVLLGVINVSWVVMAMVRNIYRWYERIHLEYQLLRVFYCLFLTTPMVLITYYAVLPIEPSTRFLLFLYGAAMLLISLGRVYHRAREKSLVEPFRYVIVGGKQRNITDLLHGFSYAFRGTAKLVGRFGQGSIDGIPDYGPDKHLLNYLRTMPNVDKIVFFNSDLEAEEELEVQRLCQELIIDLEVAPRELNLFPRGYKSQQLGDQMILTAKEEPLSMLRNKVAKRAFDIVFSLGVIVFIFPFLIPVALAVKLTSRGPVLFKQERSGYLNEVFQVYKFRTMTVNQQSDSQQATRNDARITPIGAFLRKTSLDEFPQFINVLIGDMSIVGPRPHMVKHTRDYARLIRPYMIRQKVKPGITGWAQVHGFRGPTDKLELMEKRVEHDVWYLKHWSLFVDVRCIAKTVLNIFKGEENAL